MKNYLSMKKGFLAIFTFLISLSTVLAVEVTVNFSTSENEPIEGAIVQSWNYSINSYQYFGTTDANAVQNPG